MSLSRFCGHVPCAPAQRRRSAAAPSFAPRLRSSSPDHLTNLSSSRQQSLGGEETYKKPISTLNICPRGPSPAQLAPQQSSGPYQAYRQGIQELRTGQPLTVVLHIRVLGTGPLCQYTGEHGEQQVPAPHLLLRRARSYSHMYMYRDRGCRFQTSDMISCRTELKNNAKVNSCEFGHVEIAQAGFSPAGMSNARLRPYTHTESSV